MEASARRGLKPSLSKILIRIKGREHSRGGPVYIFLFYSLKVLLAGSSFFTSPETGGSLLSRNLKLDGRQGREATCKVLGSALRRPESSLEKTQPGMGQYWQLYV